MKKMLSAFVCVLVVATLFAGCAGSLAEEAPDIGISYMLRQSALDSITHSIASIPEEPRPHHYGEFDDVWHGHYSALFYETTLEGLEYRAANIVVGRMKDDATIVLQYSTVFGSVLIGDNLVSFEITEVIKGDLAVGEIIRIGEPYYIYERFLYAWGKYMPSIPGQEYVFFLSAQITESSVPEHIGVFGMVHSERSRFPVPGGFCREAILQYLGDDGRFSADTQDFTSPVFGLGGRADVDVYSSLWEEVMNAYILPTLAS